jgi:UDP-N-acetylmuramyl pentapeptide synthase
LITTVEAAHLGFFPSIEAIADAKGEIFEGLEPDGLALVNLDNAMHERLANRARAHGARVVTFGEHETADVRLMRAALHADCSCVVADVLGTEITYKLGAPGRHLVQNSLAVLGAAKLAGADLALSALALAQLQAPKGRGARSNEMLQIMTQKGLVERDESVRPQIYRAKSSQEQTQRRLLRDLIQRNTGG